MRIRRAEDGPVLGGGVLCTKAARGPDDDRMYPWGSAFERVRCQGRTSGSAGRVGMVPTPPVGSLPGGEYPWGVREMSGNVNADGTTDFDRALEGVRGAAVRPCAASARRPSARRRHRSSSA
ncbi:hypothetical protein [Streptomyces sp. NPDC053560]|uniref:hypothetical protein n=1 Tax=Streptomyces sp. NPDC053560 TaxID=3365711 RepID=UPI0037D2407E